jgi:murein DD-endopeptidase MepM/ murein hydrolase activator NlpD
MDKSLVGLIGVVFTVSVFMLPWSVSAVTAPALLIIPDQILQGDPVMVKIEHVAKVSDVKKITFDGKSVGLFLYQGIPTALIGIDMQKKPGSYELSVVLKNARVLKQIIIVTEKTILEKPLGIPAKLGGNTPSAQNNIITELAKEKDFIHTVVSSKQPLWSKKFIYPLAEVVVTSPYGYTRKTGPYSISHKGTDYKAPVGTRVVAMNRGIVRVVKNSKTYGKTIIIDHGQELLTFYLHLSKFNIKAGQLVQQGELIGLSGDTGYSMGPHLHLTIRVNNTSIDPEKFMALFK